MSDGRCAWCDEKVDGARMGTHLKKHIDMKITAGPEKPAKKPKPKAKPKGKGKDKAGGKGSRRKGAGSLVDEEEEEAPPPAPPNRDALILKLTDPNRPDYWMFLRAHVMATLSDLDELLREAWAVCCPEHPSRFIVRGEVFSDTDGEDDGEDDEYGEDDGEDDDDEDYGYDDDDEDDPRYMLYQMMRGGIDESRPLSVPLRDVIQHKSSFWYTFDSVERLEIKITAYAEASSAGMDSPIGLLARNDPVEYECSSCHAEDATKACCTCIENNRDYLYCVGCAPEHECGDGRLVPIENTPLVGMCPLEGLSDKERKKRMREALERTVSQFPFQIFGIREFRARSA